MPEFWRRVVRRNLVCSNFNIAVFTNESGDLLVRLALRAQRFNFIADHANEGFDGKLDRSARRQEFEALFGELPRQF